MSQPRHVNAIDDDPEILALYRAICEVEGFTFTGWSHASWEQSQRSIAPTDALIVDPVRSDGTVSWTWLPDVTRLAGLRIVIVSYQELGFPREEGSTTMAAPHLSSLRKPFDLDDFLCEIGVAKACR